MTRAWCETHLDQYEGKGKGKGLNAMTDGVIAAKLGHVTRTTVRGWLTEWAKLWRAEGRWPDP